MKQDFPRTLPGTILLLMLVPFLGAVSAPLPAATTRPRNVLVKLKEAPEYAAPGNALQKQALPLQESALAQAVTAWRPFLAAAATPLSLRAQGYSAAAERSELAKWLVLTLADSTGMDTFLARLQSLPEVEFAEANRCYHLDYLPDDPLFGRQYALQKVTAEAAWEVERGSRDVVVGVIDTGVDYNHPDLSANLWLNPGEDLNTNGVADSADFNGLDDDGNGYIDDIRGWDFTDAPNYPDGGDYRGRDADPMDEMGHGTAVAGIIAAAAGNGQGMAGLAPGCRVMNLRAFTAGGNGEEDDVAAAILYAIENGAAVINMSWGDVFVSRLLDDVIHYAAGMNIVLVASAGNSATDQIHYPSAFANTISVGATDNMDQLAGFSNYGPSIDIVAPGVSILSTTRHARYDSSLNGTSFSAPYVSAAAALLLSQDRSRSPDAVRGILTTSADDLGPQGWDAFYGAGRLNMARALAPSIAGTVRIHSPWLDQGFQSGPIEIRGSAWTSSLQSYTLEWGVGDNPSSWNQITASRTNRVIDGLLGVWDNLPAQDTSYTIRLRVQNSNGTVEQSQVRIFIDHTPPVLTGVELLSLYDAENPSFLVQFNTDDLCEGSLLFRPSGSGQDWQEESMNYRSYQPRLHITRELSAGRLDLQVQAANTAGQITLHDSLLQADLSQPPLNTMRYSPLDQSLPHGHLLDRTADFNLDGRPEIIAGYFDEQERLFTALFTRDGSGFRELYALPEPAIPRSIGDSDGDGLLEVLAGYGFTTWLYEVSGTEPFSLSLRQRWQGDNKVQYWGSRLADLDGDGRSELIIRVVRSGDSASDLFEVWRTSGDGEFTAIAALPNPTGGDNFNGVPRCETGDFDGDGRSEMLFGDGDGDLYIYETDGITFAMTWQDRMPLLDTIDFIAAGDFDGDGEDEFAAGSHSDPNLNTEHTYDARHWCYRIYDKTGDNQFTQVAEWRFFGFESTKDFESGLSSGDSDGDGRAELFIAAFPDLYIAEYVPGTGYEISFHAAPIQTNAVTVVDSDSDSLPEFWASDGRAIHPWVLAESLTGPAMPVGLSASPLDGRTIDLIWHSVPGAQAYLIYRGAQEQNLAFYVRTTGTAFRDSLVTPDERYYYAVASQDTTRSPSLSLRSASVTARPGAQPGLTAALVAGERALRLRFDKPMRAELLQDVRHYLISPDIGHPATALPLASGGEVLLNLTGPFPAAGAYRIDVSGLADSDGLPLDTTRSAIRFDVAAADFSPYLTWVRDAGGGVVELGFSEPMHKASLEERTNYDPGPGLYVAWAEGISPDFQAVRLHITGGIAWGAVGQPLTIKVNGLLSASGLAVLPGRGDVIQLLFAAATLANVHTYPNPFRMWIDTGGITFADLTPEAEIRIMTTEGRTVRVLYEENGDGGLVWDVCNAEGRLVPAGIYLYRVTAKGKVKLGKLAIVK
jgi:subtilisin family serine protease